MYADVAFPISGFQTFTYKVPEALKSKIKIGSRIRAPFKTKSTIGIIVLIREKTSYKGYLKSIEFVDESLIITKELWSLAKWISNYYHTPIGKVVKTIIPFNITEAYHPKSELVVILKKSIDLNEIKKLKLKAPNQFKIVDFLTKNLKSAFISNLKTISPQALPLCRALEKKKLVKIKNVFLDTALEKHTFDPINKKIDFNKEQKNANAKILSSLKSKIFSSFLLHGVTGSGKTEVFINAVKHCISQNRSAIILLPEISLTPQIAGRFRSVFGEKVALWHSKLTKAQKWMTWNKIVNNKYKIVIGARSSVFVPLKNLGLIVVDEEQESSFRQESPSPRYNARDVSLIRAKKINAVVLLSSATPSLETYYNYLNKKIKYISLPNRYGESKYPKVHLVNMETEQIESGKFGLIFSGLLQSKIEERLNKKEQIIILQNRRGYAPVIHCFDCEENMNCPFCKMVLSYHKNVSKLICHSCGYFNKTIGNCLYCNSKSIKYLGAGTQKIELVIKKTFPKARFARLDTDSAQGTNVLLDTLKMFKNKDIDILIGTQMIAKGLDFPNATLVGVVDADIGLNIPDFRSGEKTFQLLYQASGRAGRSQKPGEVIIQSSSPDNLAIQHATMLEVKKYYKLILKEREELNYPPYSWLSKIEMVGKNKSYLFSIAQRFKDNIRGKYKGLEVLGPAPCYYEKIRNQYRFQFILKSSKSFDPNSKKLHKFVETNFLKQKIFKINYNKCRVKIHRDPLNLN